METFIVPILIVAYIFCIVGMAGLLIYVEAFIAPNKNNGKYTQIFIMALFWPFTIILLLFAAGVMSVQICSEHLKEKYKK